MIRDGGGVPPAPPIFNVDLPQSLEYPEGGRAKGINFASPLTHLLINIESRGWQGGTEVRRLDDQVRWIGGVVRRHQLAKFLPSSVWLVVLVVRSGHEQ